MDIQPPPSKTRLVTFDLRSEEFFPSILTRTHAGYFRITLSLGWQVLLWKTLGHSRITFLVPKLLYSTILTTLWSFSFVVLVLLSLIYSLKCVFHFHTVKAEFMHRIGVNYLFAPWISWLLIVESAPFVAPSHVSVVVLWWVLALPVAILDVKIYGQWFTKGKRFLATVANPASQLSVVGNLVGARGAARMGWHEVAVFLFAVGIVHYVVLFVTLYQRVSGGGDRLPASLRPVFCLFFAAPSMASLAWCSIAGRFDTGAKMLFFLSIFLFASLICRPYLFKKAMRRFSVAWWAFSYTTTVLAMASLRYEEAVEGVFPRVLSLALSTLSALVLFGLLLFTAANPKLLFPDDDPIIAMTQSKRSSRIASSKT